MIDIPFGDDLSGGLIGDVTDDPFGVAPVATPAEALRVGMAVREFNIDRKRFTTDDISSASGVCADTVDALLSAGAQTIKRIARPAVLEMLDITESQARNLRYE